MGKCAAAARSSGPLCKHEESLPRIRDLQRKLGAMKRSVGT